MILELYAHINTIALLAPGYLPSLPAHTAQPYQHAMLPGVFQNCRNIRSYIGFAICNTNDHQAVFSSYPDFTRIVTEHQLQCIGATNTNHGFGNSINRAQIILFKIIIHQFDDYFSIRLAIESIAVLQQLFFQLRVVFDNTSICYLSVSSKTNDSTHRFYIPIVTPLVYYTFLLPYKSTFLPVSPFPLCFISLLIDHIYHSINIFLASVVVIASTITQTTDLVPDSRT